MPIFFSDPCAELQAAIIAALRNDADVQAAFAPAKVLILDTPPAGTGQRGTYVIVAQMHPIPLGATDVAETEVTLDVWSVTDPPGKTKAMQIGAAAMVAALGVADLPSHFVQSVLPSQAGARYLTDTDGVSAHGILKVDFVTQPKPNP